MALTDTFVKQVKHTGKQAGDKYADSGNMFLLVKAGGKYWRMDYSHSNKRKTLAFSVYPEVSAVKTRARREKARELLAEGHRSKDGQAGSERGHGGGGGGGGEHL